MGRDLGVLEPVVVPERRLARIRYPPVVQCVAEANPWARRVHACVVIHAEVEVAVLHPGDHRRSLRELGADVDTDFLYRLGHNLAGGVPVCPPGRSDQLPAAELGAVWQLIDAV